MGEHEIKNKSDVRLDSVRPFTSAPGRMTYITTDTALSDSKHIAPLNSYTIDTNVAIHPHAYSHVPSCKCTCHKMLCIVPCWAHAQHLQHVAKHLPCVLGQLLQPMAQQMPSCLINQCVARNMKDIRIVYKSHPPPVICPLNECSLSATP